MKRFLIMLLCMAWSARLFAQTSPASVMQQAVLEVFEARLVSGGAVAANSPAFVNTITPVSTALTTAAVSSANAELPGVSATSWMAIAGLFAGVGKSISLAANGLLSWYFNANGTVTIPGVAGSALYTNSNCPAGTGGATPGVLAANCLAAIQASWAGTANAPTYSVSCNTAGTGGSCIFICTGSIYCGGQDGVPSTVYGMLVTNGTPSQTLSLHDAVSSVPTASAAEPVNPAVVASIVNSAWSAAAASPGYAGLPYATPVSVEEVAAVQASSTSWPTVGDLIQEVSAPNGVTAANVATNYTLPGANVGFATGSSTGTGGATSPVGSGSATVPVTPGGTATVDVTVNLGPDPGVAAPTLESAPTGSMILAPLLGLFPTLKNFAVPSHSAVCPTPSFSFFGNQRVIDAHCALLESVRPTMSALMALIWVGIALFIILSA